MKTLRILSVLAAAIALLAAVPGAQAQSEPKEYKTWSQKDAEKILNGSPWGKRIATKEVMEAEKDKATYSARGPAKQNTTGTFDRGDMVATEFATVVWWSARTPRRAYLRLVELAGAKVSDENAQQFAETEMPNVVVAVWGADSILRSASRLGEDDLKTAAWLDHPRLKKKIFAVDASVVKDGSGKPERILFAFPREVDGEVIVSPAEKRVVFKWKLPETPAQKLADAKQYEVIFNPEKMKSGSNPDI